MKQKVSVSVTLVVAVCILVGLLLYLFLTKEPKSLVQQTTLTPETAQTPDLIPTSKLAPQSKTDIKVIYPNGGEHFNFYQPITIQWENKLKKEYWGDSEIYLCKVDPFLPTSNYSYAYDSYCFGEIIGPQDKDSAGLNTISWDAGTMSPMGITTSESDAATTDIKLVVPPSYNDLSLKNLPPGPGNYKIKVVHYFGPDKSIIEDLSDATFRIDGDITPSVDLKVNNSDSLIEVKSGEKVKFEWTSRGAVECLAHGEGWADHDSNGNYVPFNTPKPTSGTQIVTMPKVTYSYGTSYTLFCTDKNNHQTLDNVVISISP